MNYWERLKLLLTVKSRYPLQCYSAKAASINFDLIMQPTAINWKLLPIQLAISSFMASENQLKKFQSF